MDEFNQSIELLCSMSPKLKHKLVPGQKQFRRIAGASILALKRNIRRSSMQDKSIRTIDNDNLNIVESGSSTESCDSEKWKILNKTPIIISDTESDSDSSAEVKPVEGERKEFDSKNNLLKYSLPNDKVDEIAHWISEVNAEAEIKVYEDSTTYTELSTICGSEFGENFLAKEKGGVVNSTFISNNHKRFDELFRNKRESSKISNKSLESDDNKDVTNSLRDLIIDDSFQSDNDRLKTQFKNERSKNEYEVHVEQKSLKTPPKSSVEEYRDGEDLEYMLDKLYGKTWRKKQELILPKSEPKKQRPKPKTSNFVYSERKPKLSLLYKNPYLEEEKIKSNNLLQNLQKSRLNTITKSSLTARLQILCDSSNNSESSQNQTCPRGKLNFDESTDSDEIKSNSKISKYFENKSNFNGDILKDDHLDKENLDLSDLGTSLEERIRKKMNIKDSSISNRKKGKNMKTLKNDKISNEDTSRSKKRQEIRENERYYSSSTSTSDDVPSITKSVTRKKVTKHVSVESVSISSDDDWEQEISKIDHTTTLVDGTFSFLASLSGDVPISKCNMSARIYRNNFKAYKDQLLKKLFTMYNERIFDNAIPLDTPVEWNDRMTSTAGYCYCRKVTWKSGTVERSVRVVLSTKIIDSAQRMRDTLIHEMCHAATWIVNCVSDGHGSYWKSWAFKAMKTFPELPPIKRCHGYAINTKYTYKCTGCGYSIGRHSKSLDIERKRCGYCHGKFEVLINKTSKNGETKSVPATPKKEATGFALFVKQNYGVYKTSNRKHGDVMKLLGQKFQEMKVNTK